jgi:hypothetical protein
VDISSTLRYRLLAVYDFATGALAGKEVIDDH